MTLIDAAQRPAAPAVRPMRGHAPRRRLHQRHPRPVRPALGAVRYRGTGVAMSRAPHPRRTVSAAVTVAVAGLAALITIWLGAIAQSGGVAGGASPVPERLAVVQVHAGESLQHLAARVAPGAPVEQVVARIRDLNRLETAALDAGQTLIAPVGTSADHAG